MERLHNYQHAYALEVDYKYFDSQKKNAFVKI